MKITVYTISDCSFSQQEKEYLKKNNLQFEEKNLETNREYLTEMLNISNNFAGTPVTKVEKDDGKIEILKGFTQEEFDKTFGLVSTDAQSGTNEKEAEQKDVAQNQPPAAEDKIPPASAPQPLQQSPTAAPSTQAATMEPAAGMNEPKPLNVNQPSGTAVAPTPSVVSAPDQNNDNQPAPQNQPHDPSETTPPAAQDASDSGLGEQSMPANMSPNPPMAAPSQPTEPQQAAVADPLEAVLNDLQKKVNNDTASSNPSQQSSS